MLLLNKKIFHVDVLRDRFSGLCIVRVTITTELQIMLLLRNQARKAHFELTSKFYRIVSWFLLRTLPTICNSKLY